MRSCNNKNKNINKKTDILDQLLPTVSTVHARNYGKRTNRLSPTITTTKTTAVVAHPAVFK